jgi:threonine/homoserine/homoserine lactone efflux protein
MTTAELTALLALLTAMSFTPGPNTTLSTALAANHGLSAAMRFVCAVPVGWGLLLVACALGLGALVESLPALRWAIKGIGLAYLLWLAAQLANRAQMPVHGESAAPRVGFGTGVALQFVNIKAWLNALLITAGWVAVSGESMQRLAWVLPVAMAYGFASNFTYALVGSALRQWLRHGRRLLWFNRVMAAVLVATAAWMATV